MSTDVFEKVTKVLNLKLAETVVERLDLLAAISGKVCDADAASRATPTYESHKAVVENCQQRLHTLLSSKKESEAAAMLTSHDVTLIGFCIAPLIESS